MAFTMPLAASIVFVGKWPRLQTKGQGTGPCPASSFFVTFEIILNSAALWFNFFYKYLSNKKLFRILPCQILFLWRRLCGGIMASDGQGCQSPSWQRTLCS